MNREVEFTVAANEFDTLCANVAALPEGDHTAGKIRQRLAAVFVIGIADDASAFRSAQGKAAEGVADLFDPAEVIQVVFLDIQDHSRLRKEGEKGIAVFAGLGNQHGRIAQTVGAADGRIICTDEDGGIKLRGEGDGGEHGGDGGFSVGSGNADAFLVLPHQGAEHLRALEDRDAEAACFGNVGGIVVNGGIADDGICAVNVFRRVTDGYRDACGAQTVGHGAVGAVVAGDAAAAGMQRLRQRVHGNAADTDEMNAPSGAVILQIKIHNLSLAWKISFQKK